MSSQQQAAAQQELLNHLRSTMVRNEVGKVRRCVVQLPQDRIYGLPVYNDPENAGEITSSWKGPILSKPTSSDRSFVETNKRAALKGAKTSQDFRQYQNAHYIRKVNPILKNSNTWLDNDNQATSESSSPPKRSGGKKGRRCSTVVGTAPNLHKTRSGEYTGPAKYDRIVYGKPSPGNETSASALMQAEFTTWDTQHTLSYPDMSGLKGKVRKGTKARPRHTRASRGHDIRRTGATNNRKPPVTQVKEMFKMKKFQRVKSRLDQPTSSSNRQRHRFVNNSASTGDLKPRKRIPSVQSAWGEN